MPARLTPWTRFSASPVSKGIPMDIKNHRLDGLKAGGTDVPEGTFTAYASTWTKTPDSYGDIVSKGAFANTLEAWKNSGNTIPLLFGHNMADPMMNLGAITDAKEDDHGLLVTAELDLSNPVAAQVYKMVKGRRIDQMSFAYDITSQDILQDGTRDIKGVNLYEVSVVPVGANPDTEILTVKAAANYLEIEAKAGKVIAGKHLDSLKAAHAAIGSVISAAEKDAASDDSQDEAGKAAPAQDEAQESKSARTLDLLAIAEVNANRAAIAALL